MIRDPELLEQVAEYECPDCGPFVDDEGTCLLSDDEAHAILGGDERGFKRCPDCGADVEQTLESLLGFMDMVAERIPSLGAALASRMAEALAPDPE